MSATGPDDSVDQIVFRWQGNQGRRGSGMAAAAWSCPQERADDLARELAPLLRVDGAVRPSLVRTLTKRGEAAVLRRWPTKDAGGRPNTACHLLLGHPDLLGPRFALALYAWPFSTQQFAEKATDRCGRVPYDLLREAATQAWADTPRRIAEVTDALTVATAALLRRPEARLSLRADALPGWPDLNRSAAVIRGLHEIFGHSWLPQPWTFATYDVTDRHDLTVTWVTDWTTDSGQQPRSRVDPRRPEPDLAQELAARMVERCLERPPKQAAGLPELNGKMLHDAAALPTDERLRRLARVLDVGAGSGSRPRPGRAEPPRPGGGARTDRDTDRGSVADPGPKHPPREPANRPEPPSIPASGIDPDLDLDSQGVYAEPPSPSLHAVRQALGHAGSNEEVLPLLRDLSGGIGDGPLLEMLREEDLSDTATRRLLLLLHHRQTLRDPEESHLLCAEVLRQRLYVYRSGQARPGQRGDADDHLVQRAGWLFTWAVAPYARDPRHERALSALVDVLLFQGAEVERKLLRRLVPPPESKDPVPDLPPELWRRLLYAPPAGMPTAQPTPRRQREDDPPPDPTPRAPRQQPTPPPVRDPGPTVPRSPASRPEPPPDHRNAASSRMGSPPASEDQQARNILVVFGIGAALIALLILLVAVAT
ncbi:hypothetical protein [Kitasatospora camelliae]|uniref:Uncharacterized protein n=1 Tax=Kitasatospora camelliae TaxID=3156397 RepID=A0AAU8K3V1_9ACTN